jgi:hypothetical protein
LSSILKETNYELQQHSKRNLPILKTEEKGKINTKYTTNTVNIISKKVITAVHKHPAMQARCKMGMFSWDVPPHNLVVAYLLTSSSG